MPVAEVQRGSSGEAEPMSTTPEHTSTATEERSQEKCPNLSLLEQIATGHLHIKNFLMRYKRIVIKQFYVLS